jgi:putative membrane protein
MVSDHTQANQELMLLAKSEGMDLPSQVDAKHKSAMERLQGMNGSAFDTAYMQSMVQDHEQDVADFRMEAQSGSDPALKAFAQNTCLFCNSTSRWRSRSYQRKPEAPNPQCGAI